MWRNGAGAQSCGGGKFSGSGLRGNWSGAGGGASPAGAGAVPALPCPAPGAEPGSDTAPTAPASASSVQPAWPPVWGTCVAICHCQMFLYSASVTWFATHLTPCIINFASQLTRCVIIFASRFGLCILITVCNGPRGRLQLGGAGGRGWAALAPTGAAWCSPRAQGLQTGPGGAGTAAGTCCHLLLLFPDPNLTPLPSSAPAPALPLLI